MAAIFLALLLYRGDLTFTGNLLNVTPDAVWIRLDNGVSIAALLRGEGRLSYIGLHQKYKLGDRVTAACARRAARPRIRPRIRRAPRRSLRKRRRLSASVR